MAERTRILSDTVDYTPKRMVDMADIVNNAGIAKLAGVGAACVSNWTRRYADFPEPLELPAVVGHHALYSLTAVRRWAERHDIQLTG